MTDLDPARRPGEFVVVATDNASGAEAVVRENEGLTVVLPRERADELGHDHLLVPAGRADEAVEVLRGLAR